jgi:AAA+ ATPase superfamily predicted ATPase
MEVGVIFGRRRIGKTRLVREALKNDRHLYFFIERKPIPDLLQDFQEELEEKTDQIIGGRVENITQFFLIIERLKLTKPLVIIFDEFQNFRYIDPSVFGTFQKWIDDHQSLKNITLIFIGSMFSLMKKIFTEYKEPLYGRTTGQILVKPLSPLVEVEILKDFKIHSPADLLRFHTLFGGVPRYYDLLSVRAKKLSSSNQAIRDLIVSPFAILKDEGKALLMEEFGKKYMVYFSILQAISRGRTTRSHIANATGLHYNRLGPYLDDLEKHYELIERETPILARKEKSKTSRYRVRDPFIRFWFRYLFKYSRFLELENYDTLMQIITQDLPVLEGLVFEELIKEILILLNRQRRWDFPFEDIGRYWDRRGNEIDLVAVNRSKGNILFAECKLNRQKINKKTWDDLSIKSRPLLERYPELNPGYGTFVLRGKKKTDEGPHNIWSLQDLLSMAENN